MNGPIRRIAVVCLVLFSLLLANITLTNVTRESALNGDSRNRRIVNTRFAQDRGAILVGSTAIASSKPSKDEFKFQRSYPAASAAMYAPVTGYYAYQYGSTALESSYGTQLAGSDDSQFIDRVAKQLAGQVPRGGTVETTINAKAQKAAWTGLNGRKGAVVAIDTQTGAIRALVSSPSFDPNRLATHDLVAAKDAWLELNADKDKPMLNRATNDIFSPGSTFKLIVAAAALEDGATPETVIDSSAYRLPGSSVRWPANCGGSSITLARALVVSCNPAFGRLGVELGEDKLSAQAAKFGFGERNLLGETGSVASRFPTGLDDAKVAMSSIGEYEVAATPLQLAMVAAAIANDGVLMQPYLVDSVLSSDLSVVTKTDPKQLRAAVSPQTAQALQQMMVEVVENGTGSRAKVSGVEVGGKTGTAVTDRVRLPYTWFVGYAKELHTAVCVFVEDAESNPNEATGARQSAPIAKAVWEALR